VVFLCDTRGLEPNGIDLVKLVAVAHDGKRDTRRVLADERLDGLIARKVPGICLEVQDNFGASRHASGL